MEKIISSFLKKCKNTIEKIKLNGFFFDVSIIGWDTAMISDDSL